MESYISPAKFVGFANYIRIFHEPSFWNALKNGFIYCLISIALQVSFGIGIALVLNETFKGKSFVRGLTLLPYILPTVVVALTWQWMLDGSIGVITKAVETLSFGRVNWLETPTCNVPVIMHV
jgi:multiple sugar transport system permease protein